MCGQECIFKHYLCVCGAVEDTHQYFFSYQLFKQFVSCFKYDFDFSHTYQVDLFKGAFVQILC